MPASCPKAAELICASLSTLRCDSLEPPESRAIRHGVCVGEAIHRALALACGVNDETALDRRELQASGQSVALAARGRRKRIVPAGVDDGDPDVRAALF